MYVQIPETGYPCQPERVSLPLARIRQSHPLSKNHGITVSARSRTALFCLSCRIFVANCQLLQLMSHSISHPDLHGGELPVAPSAINPQQKVFTPTGFKDTVTPRSLDIDEIQAIVDERKTTASSPSTYRVTASPATRLIPRKASRAPASRTPPSSCSENWV